MYSQGRLTIPTKGYGQGYSLSKFAPLILRVFSRVSELSFSVPLGAAKARKMEYLSRMLKSQMCALLVVLSVACTDSSPPSEEECAPHKAEWIEEAVQDRATLSEEIRKQVEAEIRRSMVASGPTIGERERIRDVTCKSLHV